MKKVNLMNNLLKQFYVVVFVLSLAAFAFVSEADGKTFGENFKARENVSIGDFGNPPSVFDPNFRPWQPPRPIPVIPGQINDVMMTDLRIIYYSPARVRQLPPKIVAFILAHEYGHVYGQTADEFQSDQFAARTYALTDMSVVKANVWFFYNRMGNQCDYTHGCGWQRAENVAKSAGLTWEEYQSVIRGEF